jgi:hypothetical protein
MSDLIEYARKGFDAPDGAVNEYTDGSNAFLAWRIGSWLKSTGGKRPEEIAVESGYSLRVDGVKIVVSSAGYGEPVVVDA